MDVSGKEYFKLTKQARIEDISDYFLSLVKDTIGEGYSELWVILDNNSTHKKKMIELLQQKLTKLYQTSNIEKLPVIHFYHTPTYSPDYNLVEYIIRILRQKLLHHLPVNTSLIEIENRLTNYFENNQLQTKEQIGNTINRILRLGVGRE